MQRGAHISTGSSWSFWISLKFSQAKQLASILHVLRLRNLIIAIGNNMTTPTILSAICADFYTYRTFFLSQLTENAVLIVLAVHY